MKKEDAEECATPGNEAAPPTAGGMEAAAPAAAPVASSGDPAADAPVASSGDPAADGPVASSGDPAADAPVASSGDPAADAPVASSGDPAADGPVASSGDPPADAPVASSGDPPADEPVASSGDPAADAPVASSGDPAADAPVASSGDPAADAPVASSGDPAADAPVASSGDPAADAPVASSGDPAADAPVASSGDPAADAPVASSGDQPADGPVASSGDVAVVPSGDPAVDSSGDPAADGPVASSGDVPADPPLVSPGAAKDTSESNSPKESESPSTPTDSPQQDHKGGGKVAEAALSQCDMADELSRQLEDILSTYCRESISDDASALLNGQLHSPVLNGLTGEREDDKPEEGKVNGRDKKADKEQKKTQDKKKVKGLGKEITLLMQTLNTLSTPEEKLAGLCKKYAELVEEHRNTQKQMRVLQKKQNQLVQEKDNLRNEHSKAILARSKLESLCRELQRHNRTLKEEGIQRTRQEEEKRKEVTSHFQVTLNDIQTQMEQHNERNASLRQENTELAEKLKKLYEQYKLREEHIDKVVKHKDLQQQLVDAKLHQAQELLRESEERHEREKDFLLKEAVESQRMCELMKQQEVHLKQQLSLYTEKFEEFQTTLSKSNEVFTTFKLEMEKMTKKIKKLEKETAMYRSRWESSNKALVEMSEEKGVRDREFEALQGKVQRLEKLRRALKVERNELNKKVQNLSGQHGGSAGAPTSDPGTDSPSPPPTDSVLEPGPCPGPEASSGSQPCFCDQHPEADALLEEANAPPVPAQQ